MHITGSVTLPTDLRSLLQLFIHINSAFAFGVSITLATVWQPSPLLMRAAILQRQIQKFLKGGGWGGGERDNNYSYSYYCTHQKTLIKILRLWGWPCNEYNNHLDLYIVCIAIHLRTYTYIMVLFPVIQFCCWWVVHVASYTSILQAPKYQLGMPWSSLCISWHKIVSWYSFLCHSINPIYIMLLCDSKIMAPVLLTSALQIVSALTLQLACIAFKRYIMIIQLNVVLDLHERWQLLTWQFPISWHPCTQGQLCHS